MLKTGMTWVHDRWLSKSWVDLAMTAGLLVLHGALAARLDVPALLAGIPVPSRPGLYAASAIAVSLTGTLASVVVAQYLTGGSGRLKQLKSMHPAELTQTWRSLFLGSAFVIVLFLTAYAADSRTHGPYLGTWLFEAGALLIALRFARLSILFSKLVNLIVLDETDPIDAPDFGIDERFLARSS